MADRIEVHWPTGHRQILPVFKVQIVNRTGEVFERREFPLHECLVDDDLGSYIREFEPLPRFHLHLHWFEVALHAINADRNAIDQ
jgi:hypothetical protein